MSDSQGVAAALPPTYPYLLNHMLTKSQASTSVTMTADSESNMQCFTAGAMFLEGQVLSSEIVL